jgi:hypothetical protein
MGNGNRTNIVRYDDMKVAINHWFEDRRTWRMYKTVPVFAAKEYEDILIKEVDKKFTAWVAGEVNAFITSDKKVAADIRIPIMNIADDVLSGRAPTVKAGDYIALQTHYQKM